MRWLIAFLAVVSCTTTSAQTDYSHLLRIQIAVEFDGERIDFDELVFCGARVKGTLTTRPVTQVLPSRSHATRVLSDGSMLGFPISWRLCSLGQEVWRLPGADPEEMYRAPDGFLPPFSWFDSADPATRTYGEAYLSETYLKAPYARLKILTPMRFSIPEHPPSEALLAEAFAQEDVEEQVRRWQVPLRMDGNLGAIPENEWRDIERQSALWEEVGNYTLPRADWNRFVAFLDSIPASAGIVRLGQDAQPPIRTELAALMLTKRRYMWHLNRLGIPQRGARNAGLLQNNWWYEIFWADESIPLDCVPSAAGNIAVPRPDIRGMAIYRPEYCTAHAGVKWLFIDGIEVPWGFGRGYVVFDARSRTIYFADWG